MAARKHYPVPTCARCKKSTSKVRNTYYTDSGEILRFRECSACGWTFWTTQQPEALVDPATHKISIANFREKAGVLSRCNVVSLDRP